MSRSKGKSYTEIKEFMRENKDSCPFCEAEINGSSNWGISDEEWQELERIHKKHHIYGEKG